ncbi:methylated-DNA--[protein]-cysteine S-methyltransferase [Gordonia amarae]|uniref:Methylated-DNA--[protein]-cysteine S-methyltransferase n=2 Tax=Gordonia amarae TaxID=36821 RepID=A0A857LMH4_9ACTN|nr:methylated-DNA--[protein]-cysteine S-methyltransferase [Gordonia amarae]MCS3878496.1 methylated-DNA-[protein]-cysteine S-methyltransferase [Gordonia amarae]QHN17107.1 methylated-DNA--[protein]-cysteine S-methyltransferase [Gordonia amarae]QHN21633.1 methylated-DNA--[protein]-cysteine S-methyltransferase [Gordonia amarae]QHN30485.1 methylated-DNA--[protein]-cysteine S-methyltransferase [Gordonia amarae]QHN39261.1 methylated-DNA--[protein]-cysteine S-methyltransferase [Gordonia amarae]
MTGSKQGTVQTVDTPDGPFTLIVDDDGRVLGSGWTTDRQAVLDRIHRDIRPTEVAEGITRAAEDVAAYYAGDLAAVIATPVLQQGTDLQRLGWSALREIPPGQPLSYTGFAAVVGNPGAVRAAASICARNAPALFVPCHRVLRSDGSLGGFAWGTDVKDSLLRREHQQSQ